MSLGRLEVRRSPADTVVVGSRGDNRDVISAWPARAAGRLARLPGPAVVALGLVVVTGIALLDYMTGPQVLLSVFYLLPVMAVAWTTRSTIDGLIVACASAFVGPIEALLAGFAHISLPVAMWNGAMRLGLFCIVLYLLERMRLLVDQLQERAMVDELTGLANLRALREAIGREIERARRFNHPLALAYLDVDDFKRVNDHSGHVTGDRVLISLASVARATARSVDTVARVGGDEFVVLMPETGAAAALPLADRIREAFSRAVTFEDTPVTCSIGLAGFVLAPISGEELLAVADALMYEAKAAGGDTVQARDVEPSDKLGVGQDAAAPATRGSSKAPIALSTGSASHPSPG
jgi:diguanylate cyclase (GGDEF)-like protein